ncbi:CsbD family protein [Novosphingobium gossypii]|uniref:CsbD family protein n=1 Tax=Novosphingobium gossypii TaxID=1604774 RepID=UPI003D1F1F90
MGELKDTAKGLGNEVAGNVKQALGKARNDPAQHAEGVAQEKKGELQQGVGKVKGALGDRV